MPALASVAPENPDTPPSLCIVRVDRTSFLGRAEELATLDARVRPGGPATLLGPPGIGKSRLAREWIHRAVRAGVVREAYEIDAAGASHAADLAARVRSALGVSDTPADPLASIAATLGARRATALLFDNAEAALDPVRRLVKALAAADVRVLVTSRERLDVTGEWLLELAPLEHGGGAGGPSVAARVFLDRLADADAAVAARTPLAVAERVARLVEGCPLALEIVASRSRVLSPGEIADALERSAGDGFGAVVPALERSIRLSHDALGDAERRAFARAAVFVDGFDRAAAAAVFELGEAEALDVLARLRDCSLVQARAVEPHAPLRFSLLRPVREFARARLDESPDAARALARHAEHYLAAVVPAAVAARAAGGPPSTWRVELGNLLAAWRHAARTKERAAATCEAAVQLDSLLAELAPLELRLEVLDDAVAQSSAEAHDAGVAASVQLARAEALCIRGSFERGIEDAERALALAEAAGDGRQRGRALALCGLARAFLRRPEAAETLTAALDVHRAVGDRVYEGRTLGWMATMAMLARDYDAAWPLLQSAASACALAGDARFEGASLGNLASIAVERGQLEEASSLLARASAIHGARGDDRLVAVCRAQRATLDAERGDAEAALAGYAEALRVFRAFTDRRLEALAELRRGVLLAELARGEAAEEALARADEVYASLGETEPRAVIEAARAVTLAQAGAVETASHRASSCAAKLGALPSSSNERAWAALLVALVEVLAARTSKVPGAARAARRTASAALAAAEGVASIDVRLASRWLRHALDPKRLGAATPIVLDEGQLVIGPAGRWFRVPGGPVVEVPLATMGRIVTRLAEAQHEGEAGVVSADDLIAAAWPEERIQPRAARTRLHNTLSRLRSIGLRDHLVRKGQGYALAILAVVADDP